MKKFVLNWLHNQRMWARKERRIIAFSALIGLIIIIFSYLVDNSAYPLPGQTGPLKDVYDLKKYLGLQIGNVPDSLLFVNVCYDKQLIDFEEEGMPVGKVTITDREKLLRFLTIAKKANNYRYIFLDVIFPEDIDTPVDSMLFTTIASMDRICIPSHKDVKIKDSLLCSKAANADYVITWKVLVFSHYQYLHEGEPSVPLKMYTFRNNIQGNGIESHWGGLWFTDRGRMCKSGITLQLPVRISGSMTDSEGQARERDYVYLGADLLDGGFSVEKQIEDKIVVIGDFINDAHRTYVGVQPGSAVILNAYIALMNGDHLIKWWYVIFLYFVYIVVGTYYLQGKSFSALFSRPWLGVLMSFLSTATLFYIIAIVSSWFDLVFNMWVPTSIYSLIDTYIQKRRLYDLKKNEI